MKSFHFLLFGILLFFSCSSSKNEENVKTSNAQNVKDISNKAIAYQISLEKSYITWIGSKPAGKHNGTILIKSGKLAVENNNVTGGNVVIDINSIQSDDLIDNPERHGRLINHLKSDDFFDAENYPEAIFEITSLNESVSDSIMDVMEEFKSEYTPASSYEHRIKKPTHNISGNLTMRDTTLSITFPAQIEVSDSILTARAKFNIDRTNWNLKYRDEASVVDKTKDRFIYNTVNVGLEIVAYKKK
ncbi:MAG: YceI family protein [Cyclobacteriaceae bacterium]|nr:YceI family protein [Cyclobacteriaceae bacterium]